MFINSTKQSDLLKTIEEDADVDDLSEDSDAAVDVSIFLNLNIYIYIE